MLFGLMNALLNGALGKGNNGASGGQKISSNYGQFRQHMPKAEYQSWFGVSSMAICGFLLSSAREILMLHAKESHQSHTLLCSRSICLRSQILDMTSSCKITLPSTRVVLS